MRTFPDGMPYLSMIMSCVLVLGSSVAVAQVVSSYAYYKLADNPEELDLSVPPRIAEKLGARLVSERDGKLHYRRKTGLFPTYSYVFMYRELSYPNDTVVNVFGNPTRFEAGQSRALYGFDAMTTEFSVVSRNLSLFLMSAYLQETDHRYAGNPDNFVLLPVKSRSEFWKRNALSMGYASQYMTRDNPFISNKWLVNGFAYAWDGISLAMIAAGPFLGNTRTDRIAIPLIGVSNLVIWRGLIYGGLGDKEIREYNRIIESGYEIPRGMIF